MEMAIVGLGRMGGNMARRLLRQGKKLVLMNRTVSVAQTLAAKEGGEVAENYQELVTKLPTPRRVWLMLPAGAATETAIRELAAVLSPGDVVIDGANNFYQEAAAHEKLLAERGIAFADAGVSGGIWGLDNGYCIMIGGAKAVVEPLAPLLSGLCGEGAWAHVGPVGSGHFVKMIHNGIEYGMMQAFAEGFSLLAAKKEFSLDLQQVASLWQHNSVVRSWLLELAVQVFTNKDWQSIAPVVADSGEGRWTVLEAVNQGIPAPVISAALFSRFDSQGQADVGNIFLARLRQAFGGHAVQDHSA
jgi:6-phosphogluconate dehydrogenase